MPLRSANPPGTTRFDINQLFEGSLRQLRDEAAYFSRLTDHNPELGRLNKVHLVKLLRSYLPPKIGIGTGFIVSGGKTPQQSPQCDLILYDNLNNTPFYKSDAWQIYPIEMVYGIIEVKTKLNKKTLRDAFEKCAKIRKMVRTEKEDNKAYVRQVEPISSTKPTVRYRSYKIGLAPRFFVFGYGGWKNSSYFKASFKKVSEEVKTHVHGVCYLRDDGRYYAGHRAHGKGEDRILPIIENGFRRFLMHLPRSLDSMLPPDRCGMGFDQLDIGHYDGEFTET